MTRDLILAMEFDTRFRRALRCLDGVLGQPSSKLALPFLAFSDAKWEKSVADMLPEMFMRLDLLLLLSCGFMPKRQPSDACIR